MRGTTLLTVAAVALFAIMALPAAGMAVADVDNETTAENETDEEAVENETADNETEDEMAPGQQLQAISGAQNAELANDISQRGFGLQIAAADSDEERAEILAERVNETEERLNEIRQQQDNLSERHGMTGLYQAQATGLGVQGHGVSAMANQSAAVADNISEDVLEQHNLSVERIQELQVNASELTGSEVSQIARNIAGPGLGQGMAGPPADVPGLSDNHTPPGMSDNHSPPGMNDNDTSPGMSDNDRPGGPDSADNDTSPGMSDTDRPGGPDSADNETESDDEDETADDQPGGNGGPGN